LRLRRERRRHRCEKYARKYCQSHYPSLPVHLKRGGLAPNEGRTVARLRQLRDAGDALRGGNAEVACPCDNDADTLGLPA
jgi:hypothetical protein